MVLAWKEKGRAIVYIGLASVYWFIGPFKIMIRTALPLYAHAPTTPPYPVHGRFA